MISKKLKKTPPKQNKTNKQKKPTKTFLLNNKVEGLKIIFYK